MEVIGRSITVAADNINHTLDHFFSVTASLQSTSVDKRHADDI